jgi:hypothetical protein
MYQDIGDMIADQERVAMQQGGMVQMPGSMTAAQFNPTNPTMGGLMAPVTIDPVVPQAQVQNNPEQPQQMMPMPQMQESGQMDMDLGEAPVGMMSPPAQPQQTPVNVAELQAGGMVMDSPEEDFQRMGDPMQVQPMRNPLAVMNPLLNPDLRTA